MARKVERASKKEVNNITKINGQYATFSDPSRSSCPTAEKSGAENTPFQFTRVFVAIAAGQYAVPSPQYRPIGIEMIVVNTMPSINAPVTFRETRIVVAARPIRNVITTGLSDAECTIVTGSLMT